MKTSNNLTAIVERNRVTTNKHPVYCKYLGNRKCGSEGVVECLDTLKMVGEIDYAHCSKYKKLEKGN